MLVGPFLLLDHLPPLAALVAAVDRWHLGDWLVDQDWLLQRYRFRASGVGALADVGLALTFAALVGLSASLRDGCGIVWRRRSSWWCWWWPTIAARCWPRR